MKEKTRKILIMAVMAALIISLMAASLCYAFTYGRYSGGRLDDNSTYDDLIDFVGATAFEVSTPDEFVNAVENGYSYIKISEGAEKPFVINNDIADVYTNLVLDVNGTTVIRNSRNPVLDVRRSISVVLVYDSSVEGSGGFYNPVGSALQTSGGSLTVGSGSYESGPKVKGSSSFSSDTSVTLYTRTSRTAGSYETKVEDTSMPSLSGDVYYTGDTTQYTYIENDTYLLYTEVQNAFVGSGQTADGTIPDASAPADPDNPVVFQSGQLYINCDSSTIENNGTTTTTYSADIFSPVSNVASCDFYYYYPIDNDAYSTTAGSPAAPKTYAVVYGYNDVKGLAEDEDDNNDGIGEATALIDDGLVWPYAAIRSVEDGEVGGVTHARGGEFYTYFGEENTHSIYSEGGTMTVGLSGESADAPTFQAIGKGVCINMAGTIGNADQTLTINNGEFSSQLGNTIEMSGGEMEVKKGTFKKDATVLGAASGDGASNGSAISISGGTLTSSDTEDTSKPIQFHISGSYVNGIYAKGGEVNIANATFVFENGKNNQGVYNDGGTSRARWCEFSIPGDNNYGIHSTNGTTRASYCTINMTGEYAVGVYTTGGRALVEGGIISVAFAKNKSDGLLTSAAVSTQGGEIYLAGKLTIESASLGVTVRKVDDTEGSLEIADQEIKIENNTYEVAKGDVTIDTPNATGIYINNGSLTNKGTVTVTSSVGYQNGRDKGWSWVDENGNAIPNFNKYNGVYVQGGSLVSEGTLNVTHTGVESDKTTGAQAYLNHLIKSYAVRVEAAVSGGKTEVSIAGGTISNSVGGGVLVNGGTVTLGKQETTNGVTTYSGPTVQTTGTENYDFNNTDFEGNWNYKVTETGGDAVKVANGNLTIYGGEYTSKQGNGILVQQNETGTSYQAEVYGGTFSGDDVYSSNTGNDSFYTGPGASYAFKVLGGTLTIYDGIFTSNDGGAFVMNGEATMYGGIIAAQGATAFVTYTNATVTFDPTTELTVDGVLPTGRTLYVSGASSGLTVEETSGTAQKITINGGTFTGGTYEFTDAENQAYSVQGSGSSRNGIWYGNGGASLSIAGGTIVGSGLNSNNTSEAYARALYLDSRVYLQAGKIQISGGTFNGGRDAIYVDATGEKGSVLITDGTFNGQKDSDGGCALWFEEYHDDPIFQISGGAFSSAGGAINGNTGRGWTEMKTGNIFASEAYCFTTKPTAGTVQSAAIYNRTGWRPYSYYQVGGSGSGSNASISFGDTVYNSSGNSLGDFNELTKIVVRSDFVQQIWPS